MLANKAIYTYLSQPPTNDQEYHAVALTNSDLSEKKLSTWWSQQGEFHSDCDDTALLIFTQQGDGGTLWSKPEAGCSALFMNTFKALSPQHGQKYINEVLQKFTKKNAVLFKVRVDQDDVRYIAKYKLQSFLPVQKSLWLYVLIAVVIAIAAAILARILF